jgi:flagellar hook-length control protein FliK
MSSRIAETLLSGTQAARGVELTARSSERREAFAPVLNEALASGARTAPDRRTAVDDADDAPVDDHADGHDAATDELDETPAGTAASAESESDEQPDDGDEDALEISVEAAAVGLVAAIVPETAAGDAVPVVEAASGDAAIVDVAEAVPANDEAPSESQAASPEAKVRRLREFQDVLPRGDQSAQVDAKAADAIPSDASPVVELESAASVEADATIQTDDANQDAASSLTDSTLDETAIEVAESDGEGEVKAEDGLALDQEPERRESVDPAEGEANAENRAPDESFNTEADLAPAEPSTRGELQAEPESRPVEAATPANAANADTPPADGAPRDAVRSSGDRTIHTPAAGGLEQADHVERARFVGRVEGAIRAAGARDGRISVRLSPPELGALRIELNMHQGVMTARVEADTMAARNLLLDNLPALRDRLAQQDVRIDRFDVDVRRDGSGSSQQQMHDRPSAQGDERRYADRRDAPSPRGPAKPNPTTTAASRRAPNAALDVRV